jgi:hypothetical protein
MSTDTFEDELRSLLQDGADAEGPAYVDVDPGTVLLQGRRVVRGRRIATGAGIAACALVLGTGAWAVLDQSSGPDRLQPVPATRSATVAPEVVSATMAVEGNPGVATYTVHLDRSTGRVSATDTSPTGKAGLDVPIGRMGEGEQKAVWATVSRDPFIVLGVVPAEADQLMTRFENGDVGGARTDEEPLGTTAYKAFMIRTEKSPQGAALTGLDWAANGRVLDVEGHELPSATLGDRTVYRNDAAGELGLVTPDGSSRVLLQSATSGGATPHLTTAVEQTGKPTVTTFVIILPVDAGDISLDLAAGATLESQQSAPLVDGSGLAVLATVQSEDSADPVVRQVTWTADGRQSSWRDVG